MTPSRPTRHRPLLRASLAGMSLLALAACDAGASTFVESGPGTVLSGLVKRIVNVKEQKILNGEKLLKEG